ncbi:DUF421 domain-containing protein [Anaerosolibacter sp.]|uniref:DUF421 domain-containing protein n=1 Tax=Anaerosolibacter sp. TaxID=1872527 RepID=UPI0039F004CA
MTIIWKALLLICAGMLLLRIAGRKSISQMTIAQSIIMISIGSLIVQPIAGKSVWRTLAVAVIFISFLILMEYLQVKFDSVEKFITGRSKVVIDNGQVVPENLKKLRLTVDQLEIRLRQLGIKKISDVKTATLEPNGQLGYELMRHAQPVTIGDLEQMLGALVIKQQQQTSSFTIFDEVKQGQHQNIDPGRLQ